MSPAASGVEPSRVIWSPLSAAVTSRSNVRPVAAAASSTVAAWTVRGPRPESARASAPNSWTVTAGSRAGARLLVVGWCVDVEHGVQVRVERGDQGVRLQRGVVQPLDRALVEQEGGPQPVLLHQPLGPRGEPDPVRGRQRLRVSPGHRQRHVRLLPLVEGAQHPPDEGRVQERQVGGADEGGVGASVERGEPGRDALHRPLAVPWVVHHHGAFRQRGEVLAAGPNDDDGPAGRAGEDADRPGSSVDPCHSSAALGTPIREDRPPASTTPAEAAISSCYAPIAPPPETAPAPGRPTPIVAPWLRKTNSNRQPGAAGISQKTEDNSLGRLLALSDGVFAIAMTLLALDLTVPDDLTAHPTSQQLIHALALHTDSYWSFLLSFYVIAIYWGGHRRLMRSVTVFNPNLVRDTAFLLLIVAAMPFPTSVLGKYGGTAFALALYGAINALATLALILLTYDVRRSDPAAACRGNTGG